MKAEELMIGDWIQNPLGWKARVMSIKHTNVFRDEWEWLFKIGINNDTFQSNLSEDEVLPIPLTPEILEKNGWISDNSNDPLRVYNLRHGKGYSTIAISDDGKLSIEVSTEVAKKDKRGRADLITFVRDWCDGFCVHELQHALKLCGIDKEIVI